ncbi:hypothetical protein RYX36_012058, partial [Vicia faba]
FGNGMEGEKERGHQSWRIRVTAKAKHFNFRFRFKAATHSSTHTLSFFRFSILLNLPHFLFTISSRSSHPNRISSSDPQSLSCNMPFGNGMEGEKERGHQSWRIRVTAKAKHFNFRFRFKAATHSSTHTLSFFRFSILLNLPHFLFTISSRSSHPNRISSSDPQSLSCNMPVIRLLALYKSTKIRPISRVPEYLLSTKITFFSKMNAPLTCVVLRFFKDRRIVDVA